MIDRSIHVSSHWILLIVTLLVYIGGWYDWYKRCTSSDGKSTRKRLLQACKERSVSFLVFRSLGWYDLVQVNDGNSLPHE